MLDQIDCLSGIEEDSGLFRIRRQRPEFVDGANLCRQAVLEPRDDADIDQATRASLCARMARQIGHDDLAATYDARLAAIGSSPELLSIASNKDVGTTAGSRIAALMRYADLVTKTPGDTRRSDIEALAAAGLNKQQIVALAELVAFVNFEARVISGLALLGNSQ